MLTSLKRLAVLLVFILVAVQFFQPARTNPPVDPYRELHANLAVDAAVATVFERSCNDCHFFQPRLPARSRQFWLRAPRHREAVVRWPTGFRIVNVSLCEILDAAS